MIQRQFLLSLITTLIICKLHAQVEIYKSKDGDEVEIDVIDRDPDNGRKNSLYVGIMGVGGMKYAGFDHYEAKKYFFTAMAGPNNFLIDGNYFFLHSTKNIKIKQTVKSGPAVTNYDYVAHVPSLKRRSFGAHLCVNHLNQLSNSDASYYPGQFKTTEINPGITYLTAKNAKLKMSETNIRQGSSYRRINLDAVFYTFSEIDNMANLDDELNKVGFRFYIDGRATDWGSGRFAIKYLLGVQSSPYKMDVPNVMGGIGFGYCFNFKKQGH